MNSASVINTVVGSKHSSPWINVPNMHDAIGGTAIVMDSEPAQNNLSTYENECHDEIASRSGNSGAGR